MCKLIAIKTGYSILPICNTFKAGTWWKMYADGSSNNGKVIQARSYDGYSYLPICNVYKCIIKKKRGDLGTDNTNSNVVGKAVVGNAIVGEAIVQDGDVESQIGMFRIGYSQLL